MKTLARKLNEKLIPCFYGPFKVFEKVGIVAYRLELPPTACILPVFHVSQLKQSVHSAVINPTIPPTLSDEFELQVQPQDIRRVRKLLNGQRELLVKWQDLLSFKNSWEDADLISKQFPAFSLEDKVKLFGEGDDRACNFTHTYKRTSKRKNDLDGKALTGQDDYPSVPGCKEQ